MFGYLLPFGLLHIDDSTGREQKMIPRVIYTYWEGPECPVVEHCIRRLRKSNVDCRLVRLSIADAPQTDGLMDLKACHVADWVRMWYLGTYIGWRFKTVPSVYNHNAG